MDERIVRRMKQMNGWDECLGSQTLDVESSPADIPDQELFQFLQTQTRM